jgi:uncharacterized protein (DUF924 family)
MKTKVLNFWFHEINKKKWWVKDRDFDLQICQRFSDLHTSAVTCELFKWRESPEGRLAEIIILDQFSRNIFRDTPKAFASDSQALALAQEAVLAGDDMLLNETQRSFLYMPFMHSESLEIHNVAFDLFKKNCSESNFRFEARHRDIIKQFGRYPHRNRILGRTSTKDELEFLDRPGSSF